MITINQKIMRKIFKYIRQQSSFIRYKGSYKILGTVIYLLLISFMFIGCADDEEFEPTYEPVGDATYGEEEAFVQEVSFYVDGFIIVGDLRTPVEGELHPLIMMIHGSGSATRDGSVPFEPLIEIFLRHGFAVLSWDKPGSGDSKGTFTQGYTVSERAKIIAKAVNVMKDNTAIDNATIGLWGISQAGWVMPKALELTDDIAFMIVVGGGGEEGIKQTAYHISQVAACAGESAEDVEKVDKYWVQMAKATTYSEYREAVDFLVQVPSIVSYTGIAITEENSWSAWPQDIDAFDDPMDIIKTKTLPILALFGEFDKNVDPVQGAAAYKNALDEAGNVDYTIEVLEGAGHVLAPALTGCPDEFVSNEYVPEYLEILDEWVSLLNK